MWHCTFSWPGLPEVDFGEPSVLFTPSQAYVYLDLNRNQTAMPPSSSYVTTPVQDNEDLLVLIREHADTKHTALQSLALSVAS